MAKPQLNPTSSPKNTKGSFQCQIALKQRFWYLSGEWANRSYPLHSRISDLPQMSVKFVYFPYWGHPEVPEGFQHLFLALELHPVGFLYLLGFSAINVFRWGFAIFRNIPLFSIISVDKVYFVEKFV